MDDQEAQRRERNKLRAPLAAKALDLVQAALYEPFARPLPEAVPTLERLVLWLADRSRDISEEEAADVYMYVQAGTYPWTPPAPLTPQAEEHLTRIFARIERAQ